MMIILLKYKRNHLLLNFNLVLKMRNKTKKNNLILVLNQREQDKRNNPKRLNNNNNNTNNKNVIKKSNKTIKEMKSFINQLNNHCPYSCNLNTFEIQKGNDQMNQIIIHPQQTFQMINIKDYLQCLDNIGMQRKTIQILLCSLDVVDGQL